MTNRDGHKLISLAIASISVIWVNDFLAALVRGDEYGPAGYFVHLAAFAAVAIYAYRLRLQHGEAVRRLAACHHAWRLLPGALALVRRDSTAESFGDDELARLCSLVREPGSAKAEAITLEELTGPDGGERVIERRIIPLSGLAADGYTAEFLIDVTDRVRAARDREEDYVRILQILVNMFEMKDPYSNGHSEAVSNLARDLAGVLGLSRAEIAVVSRAAVVHDIGKIIIPPEILAKAGALTTVEQEAIQAHAAVGADILASLGVFREEASIVRHHHERWDGKGYPAGLAGAAIPLGSRIIAVADAFDAMTAGRSARGRRDMAAALAVLEAEKGGQFDPNIVNAFISLVNPGRGRGGAATCWYNYSGEQSGKNVNS